MNTYEEMLDLATKEGIIIDDHAALGENEDGYWLQTKSISVILLNKNLSTRKVKKCRLAEELGHHYTTVGDITDQSKVENRKQERRARGWGYERSVPLTILAEAINYPCINTSEVCEYLDVTEDYFEEAIAYYKSKYGLFARINNYLIYFEPLGIAKLFKE